MKVLFICSGNSKFELSISPFIKEQAESLMRKNIEVEFFPIKGKGFFNYIKHVFFIRKFLKQNQFDLIHAYFIFSGIVALFMKDIPVIITFLG